jgi:hypothetical protein|tara:strand:+ start:431 stop:676 length:246 start_codon:yes stop_codon:yes gene_type:complete
MKREELRRLNRKVWELILKYKSDYDNGFSKIEYPSYGQTARDLEISKSLAQYHWGRLRALGYVDWDEVNPRQNIRIIEKHE